MNSTKRDGVQNTSLLAVDVYFDSSFFERSPLEVFLVATALHLSLRTLLAARLLFVTLQTFRFACYAAWEESYQHTSRSDLRAYVKALL
jgi:hypothetical protein